jgi:hypothetical protein
MPASENTIRITNVSPTQCIAHSFQVQASYTNKDAVAGEVELTCGSATVVPAIAPAPGDYGDVSFTVTHTADGTGHTMTAKLKHGSSVVKTDDVLDIGVNNACPIVIEQPIGFIDGLPAIPIAAELCGTFKANLGNEVVILVEERLKVNNKEVEPKLAFADSAVVDINGNAGKWKHKPFQGAKPRQHIRIILTKDGKVIASIRAIYK